MNKKLVLKKFLENKRDADEWLEKVPTEINDAFFDNPYINSAQLNEELLLALVFGRNKTVLIVDFCCNNFICHFNCIDTIDGFVDFICEGEK